MLSDEYHETHEYAPSEEYHETHVYTPPGGPHETHECTLLDERHELKKTHERVPYAQPTSARDAGRARLLKQVRYLVGTATFIRTEVS